MKHTWGGGGEIILPNVSYCKDVDVHFNPITFYIYHSSDCNVKKYTIPKGQPFDLTSVVNDGYYYGGYFSAYGGAINYSIENPKEGKVEGDIIYDGSSSYFRDENNKIVRYWLANNAYNENGTTFSPEDGSTYFLCETPKEYTMKQKINYIYDTTDNSITNFINIYTVDSARMYSLCSANIITNSGSTTFKCNIAGSYTSGSNKIDPEIITGRKGGYIAIKDFARNVLPPVNSVFIIENTLTTLDGISNHSYVKVTTNDWKNGNINVEYSDIMPSLD